MRQLSNTCLYFSDIKCMHTITDGKQKSNSSDFLIVIYNIYDNISIKEEKNIVRFTLQIYNLYIINREKCLSQTRITSSYDLSQ